MSKRDKEPRRYTKTREGMGHLLSVRHTVSNTPCWLFVMDFEEDVSVELEKRFNTEFQRHFGKHGPADKESLRLSKDETAWRIAEKHLDRTKEAAEDAGEQVNVEVFLCDDCLRGEPCDLWTVGDILSIGYEPHAPSWLEGDEPFDDEAVEAIAQEFLEAGDHWGDLLQAALQRFNRMKAPALTKRPLPAISVGEATIVLGLDKTWPCELTEVDLAFKKSLARVHPDHGGTDADTARVHEARIALRRALEQEA